MSQQSRTDEWQLRVVPAERMARQAEPEVLADPVAPEGSTAQSIWEIVRKSTDVILALREENAILRNELTSLRNGEAVLSKRIQDLLTRIDVFEACNMVPKERKHAPTGHVVNGTVSESDETLVSRAGSESRSSRTTTITITIQDDARADVEQRVSGLVQSLVEELTRGI